MIYVMVFFRTKIKIHVKLIFLFLIFFDSRVNPESANAAIKLLQKNEHRLFVLLNRVPPDDYTTKALFLVIKLFFALYLFV